MLRQTRSLACLLVLTFVTSRICTANTIGVGLDWRSGVFVQEYWHKGTPHYLLANLSKEAVEITVHDFDSKWRLGQPLPKPLAGPWKVPAGGHSVVDAKPLLGEGLRRFVIGGKQPLGLLPSPSDPGYKGESYATQQGLNGSGGAVSGVYLVQPKLELAGGSKAKIVLHVPGKSGVIKFKREPEKNDDPLRPASLTVDSATCETLPISRDDKQTGPTQSYVVIDTESPKEIATSHEVVLNVVLPKVKEPQFLMLDGWLARKDGGGNGITRGFWIVP